MARMEWWNNFSDTISSSDSTVFTGNGVVVQFSVVETGFLYANITSYLQITDIQAINGSEFTCEVNTISRYGNDSVTICVSGKVLTCFYT